MKKPKKTKEQISKENQEALEAFKASGKEIQVLPEGYCRVDPWVDEAAIVLETVTKTHVYRFGSEEPYEYQAHFGFKRERRERMLFSSGHFVPKYRCRGAKGKGR